MAHQMGAGQRALDQRFAEGLECARWAVGRWSAFPVDDMPRPLVMVGERIFVEHGFETGEAKLAFIDGRIDWQVAVPEAVRGQLKRHASGTVSRPPGTPLVITGADRAEMTFVTDRGPRLLPAWRLQAHRALGPIWILDPDLPDWRPCDQAGSAPPDIEPPGRDPGAKLEVADDDCAVTLFWLGAAPEYERYPEAQVIESDRAVTLVARGEDLGWTGFRRAIGHVHRVPARLRLPLGARVFVGLDGTARQAIKIVT
jgi:hypothetical protein